MHELSLKQSREISRADLIKAGVVLGLTVLTVIICLLTPPPKPGGGTGVAMQLPDRVGPFVGKDEAPSPAELAILPPDTTYAKASYGPPGSTSIDRIHCEIVLSGAEKRSIHRPERCLPAQGLRIENSHTESIQLASGHTLKVTALYLDKPVMLTTGERMTLHQYFLYWFVGEGITTPYHLQRILMTNWDLLFHRINQRWAYVTVSTVVSKDFRPDGLDADQTLNLLKQFIHESAPTYMISEMPKTAAQ